MWNARINNVFSFIFFYVCFVAVAVSAASSQEVQWIDVSDGIRERGLRSVAVDPGNPDTVFISSDVAVYKSFNGGGTWDEILSFRTTGNSINTIFIPSGSPLTVYTGSRDGLFRSSDGGSRWERVFSGVGPEENSVLTVAVNPKDPGRIVIGTEAGLFVSEDDGKNWTKGQNLPSDTAISFIAIDNSNPYKLYAAADKGLYKSFNGGIAWRRILDTNTPDDDLLLSTGEEEYTPEIGGGRTIRSIVIDPSDSGNIYIATSEGLRISGDGGDTWKRAGSLGLGSLDIRHILLDGDENKHIYAATGRGVFRYSLASDIWQELYKGMISADAYYLALSLGHEAGSETIWAATNNRVFKAYMSVQSPDSITVPVKSAAVHDRLREMDVLSLFSHEPTIEEVMDAAMRYAEVEPEKIAQWREAAARRAWLPDLRVAYDKNKDWQSSSYFYSTSSEKYKDNDITSGRDDGWSVSATWELGELIWNNDQTSIDSRSKLMVQLRDDVLNEVTRLYFERRRLQVGTLLSPPESRADTIEKNLRLQELTAGIDALTGSYFSRKIAQGTGIRAQRSGKLNPDPWTPAPDP